MLCAVHVHVLRRIVRANLAHASNWAGESVYCPANSVMLFRYGACQLFQRGDPASVAPLFVVLRLSFSLLFLRLVMLHSQAVCLSSCVCTCVRVRGVRACECVLYMCVCVRESEGQKEREVVLIDALLCQRESGLSKISL